MFQFFGAPDSQPVLPLPELLNVMERAVANLEDERQRMEQECDQVLENIRGIIDEMSDLRYGKLANSGTEKQVVTQLQNLTEACERKLQNNSGDHGDEGDTMMK